MGAEKLDWEKILSIVTAVTAVVGIALTWIQISESNKQALFTHRIKVMGYAKNLFNIYADNKENIIDEYLDNNSPDFTAGFKFLLLTSTPELKNVSKVINNPITELAHTNYMIELNNISQMGSNINLLFNGENAEYVSDFVTQYQLTLRELYKYQIVLKRIKQDNENNQVLLIDLQKKFNEPTSKEKLRQQLNKLDQAYQKVEDHNCFAKLENETRLE